LAPFPNRIAGGKYNFEGREYALEINEKERGHALHGLFYNRLFRFVSKEITENRAVITFQSSLVKNEFTGYPFALHIEIQFTLRVEELEIQVTATNQGEVNLPYGVGWHPYFLSKSMINNSELKLPSTEVMEFSKEEGMELIPTGNSISSEGMQDNHLGDTKLDTCFLNPESRPVVFEDLEIKMDSQMKYLQIYTPEDRKSIAIEPMSCAPDSYNNQLGLITLKPEEKIRHTFGVKLNNNQI
jgi:aldose 1-epimerase